MAARTCARFLRDDAAFARPGIGSIQKARWAEINPAAETIVNRSTVELAMNGSCAPMRTVAPPRAVPAPTPRRSDHELFMSDLDALNAPLLASKDPRVFSNLRTIIRLVRIQCPA